MFKIISLFLIWSLLSCKKSTNCSFSDKYICNDTLYQTVYFSGKFITDSSYYKEYIGVESSGNETYTMSFYDSLYNIKNRYVLIKKNNCEFTEDPYNPFGINGSIESNSMNYIKKYYGTFTVSSFEKCNCIKK